MGDCELVMAHGGALVIVIGGDDHGRGCSWDGLDGSLVAMDWFVLV